MKSQKIAAAMSLALTGIISSASFVGIGGEETFLNDGAEVIHTFNESGTFSLFSDSEVRILVVAGGGGGGYDCSGGGGGGGVIETNLTLTAGEYKIIVGSGGAGSKGGSGINLKGRNGENSIFSFTDGLNETILLQAIGGGGGGGYSNGSGLDGGSGGGPANGGKAGKGVEGQGYPSVDASTSPQGGGGAGGSPIAVHNGKGNSTTRMSSGGVGYASDITGAVDYYGPGGGAGGYNGLGGLGGDSNPDADGYIWGCGATYGLSTEQMAANFQYKVGRPNHGGGGGGGSNSSYAGSDGSSGVVILRLANELTVEEPIVSIAKVVPHVFSATLTSVINFAGKNSQTGKLTLWLQKSSDLNDFEDDGGFSGEEIKIGDLISEDFDFEIKDLRPERAYHLRLRGVNDAGDTGYSSILSFTMPVQTEPLRFDTYGRIVVDGLLQKSYSHTLTYPVINGSDEDLVVMPGNIASGLSTYSNDSGIYKNWYEGKDGVGWTIKNRMDYTYIGYMWFEAGSTYNFYGNYEDNTKLTIDGVTILQCGYSSPGIGSYECTEEGWHRIQIWHENSTNNAGNRVGWSFAFGWNQDGPSSVNGTPGNGWNFLHIDYGAKLKTGTPGKDITINSYTPNGSNVDFNLGIGIGVGDTGSLYAVYGDTYAGEDFEAWENSMLIQSLSTEAVNLEASIPKSKYTRFVVLHEDTSSSWSTTAQLDFSIPVIKDLGVIDGGDTGKFSVDVSSLGTGDLSLNLFVSTSSDMSNAIEVPIAVSEIGEYSTEITLVPGTTYYYYFAASTSDNGVDKTDVTKFTTKAAAIFPESPTVTVNNRTVSILIDDYIPGAGNNEIKVFVGPDEENLVEHEYKIVADNYNTNIQILLDELPQTWKIYVLVENTTTSGEYSWSTNTGILTATTKDIAKYCWNKEVTEGEWTDPNNWIVTSMPKDGVCTGYPTKEENSPSFVAETFATIYIPEVNYIFDDLHIGNIDNSSIKFIGIDSNKSKIHFDMYGGDTNNEYLEFSSMTLTEKDRIDSGVGAYNSTNTVIKFTNNAISTHGSMVVKGTNVNISVESRSLLQINNEFKIGVIGEALTVNDATFSAKELMADTAEHLGNVNIRLSGTAPQINISSAILVDSDSDAGHNDLTITFDVPNGGYTNAAPLYATSSKVLPLGTYKNADSTAKLIVKIDPKSEQLRGGDRAAEGHLILWESGIDTNNVIIESTKGVIYSYTYGWPSDLDRPSEEGQLPTGIRCIIPPTAGTIIMIR